MPLYLLLVYAHKKTHSDTVLLWIASYFLPVQVHLEDGMDDYTVVGLQVTDNQAPGSVSHRLNQLSAAVSSD